MTREKCDSRYVYPCFLHGGVCMSVSTGRQGVPEMISGGSYPRFGSSSAAIKIIVNE